jgi:RNA polymerase sigma-70 factor (ECF subfamily)
MSHSGIQSVRICAESISGHVSLIMSHTPNSPGQSFAEGPDSTSVTLLERIKLRDPDGWQRLTDLYSPLVYRWCRHCRLGPEDAADVVQEVFVAVARRAEQFRRERPSDSFRGWLWTIAQNKIRDHFRQHQGKLDAEGGTIAQQRLGQIAEELSSSSGSFAEAGQDSSLEHRAVELARASVEDRTWQAFWKLTVEDIPAAEVAERLGMSVPAVYKAKYRVMRLVRKELDDLIE